MFKSTDLSDFDKGQNKKTLGQTVSKTVFLDAVVSTHQKGSKEGQWWTSSRARGTQDSLMCTRSKGWPPWSDPIYEMATRRIRTLTYIRPGPWSIGRRWPNLMKRIFIFSLFFMWIARFMCITGEEMAPGWPIGKREAGICSVMLWAMFRRLDIAFTCSAYLNRKFSLCQLARYQCFHICVCLLQIANKWMG